MFSSLRRRVWKTETKFLPAEGRDTPVFGGGEIFHTIFISAYRTHNIWYGKLLTHLFMENAFIHFMYTILSLRRPKDKLFERPWQPA